jgi:hypothetical protein
MEIKIVVVIFANARDAKRRACAGVARLRASRWHITGKCSG